MRRWMRILSFLAIVIAGVADTVEAQPGGRGGRGGRGGVSPEQILGIAAFDAKAAVTDQQLIRLRNALKPIRKRQQELMASVRSGERDFGDVRDDMMALRGEAIGAVSSVLSEAQVEAIKQRMQRQGRGGRGG